MQRIATTAAWLLLVMIIPGLPVVVTATFRAMESSRNDIVSWAAPDSEARQNFEHFQEHFGSNDVIFLSWDGCSIDDARLETVPQELKRRDLEHQRFANILTLQSVIDDQPQTPGLDKSTISESLVGILVGDDQKTARITIELTSKGSRERGESITTVISTCTDSGVLESDLRLAGPAYQLFLIDRESLISPLRIVPAILLLMLALTWYHLRQTRLTFLVLTLSTFAGFGTTALIYASGVTLNAVIWTLPTLIALLTTSSAIHLLNYHRSYVAEFGTEGAIAGCLNLGWRPTLASSMTTACGLASLTVSETLPIRQFGIFGAIGVLTGSALVVIIVPVMAGSRLFGHQSPIQARQNATRAFNNPATLWKNYAEFVIRYRALILVSAIGPMILLSAQLQHLTTSVSLDAFFKPDSRPLQDERWIEDNIGAAGTTELLLTFHDPVPSRLVDRLRLIAHIESNLRQIPGVDSTLSATTLVPTSQLSTPVDNFFLRLVANRRIQSFIPKFEARQLIATSDSTETWRISVGVPRQDNNNETVITDQILQVAQADLKQVSPEDCSRSSAILTGLIPLSREVETQFRSDLIKSYLTGFGSIFLVLLCILRNPITGVFVTIPNAFPAAIVLGWVSFRGISLDVGSVMTASVALGIAVDDTLHFILWHQRRISEGFSKHDSIVDTLRHCGPAMIQTSTICGFGTLLYAFSWFLPTARFGTMLSGMMGAALVGDLLVLPALIATTIGTFMFPPRSETAIVPDQQP